MAAMLVREPAWVNSLLLLASCLGPVSARALENRDQLGRDGDDHSDDNHLLEAYEECIFTN